MRITITHGAFLPVPPLLGGAIEKVWMALGAAFADRGHTVLHVSRRHPDLPHENVVSGVRHLRVAGFDAPRALWRLKLRDLRYSRRVRAVLPAADVLVTNSFWLPLLERRSSRGRPYVHVARFPKGQLRLYPARAILQTVSAPVRDAILHEVPSAAHRVRVIPYPLSPAYLVPRREPENVILYAGRIHPEKGLHVLVEAFTQLRLAGEQSWTLRIIGPWETRQGGGGGDYRAQLVALARRAGKAIQFTEPLFDERALVEEYRRAAIFVYPSLAERGETFGLAALEAMAAGCAPVVSRLACFRDFIVEGANGLIFDHRSSAPAAALAGALEKLVRSPDLREPLRAAAWNTARHYTLPQIADRFLSDFQTISERPSDHRSNLTHVPRSQPERRAG